MLCEFELGASHSNDRYDNMTLRSRLAMGLVIIAIILVGPLAYAIQSLSGLRELAVTLRDQDFAASLLVSRLREGLNEVRRQELALLFAGTPADRSAAMDKMTTQLKTATTLADSLNQASLPSFASSVSASVQRVADAAPREYEAAVAGDKVVADSVSERILTPALARADSTLAEAERTLRDRTETTVDEQARRVSSTQRVSVVAMVIALLIAAGFAIWLTRSISGPIVDLKRGMQAVAGGALDYDLGISAGRSDEFGQLAASFQEMTRQLGELDKLKAEFVSVASHELKTPINVMIGYLQLLDDGVYGPLTQKQRDVHRTLVVQANTLLRLVKQLLDVSRFEAGGGRVEPRPIEISQMLAELESAFHVLAVQREVDFHVVQKPGLPDEVCWDLDRINEVIGNLLSNAFKFTPRGGSVDLTVEPTGTGVAMEVKDTGAGIAPEQLPRIFDKFYQADNQASAGAVGTGLGLAIAKQIVDAHGGTISCESTPGVGTTFRIILPARVARRPSAQRATPLAVA